MRPQDKPTSTRPARRFVPSRPARRRVNLLSLRIALGRVYDRWRENPLAQLLDEHDRWFIWLPVAMALGVSLYFALPREPFLPVLTGIAAVLIVAAGMARSRPLVLAVLAMLAAVALGAALAGIEAHRAQAPTLQGRSGPVTVEGRVLEVEKRDGGAWRYTLKVERVSGYPAHAAPDIVTVTRRGDDVARRVGENVSVRSILMPPPEPAAPGGFDFARRAYLERIGAVGFAIGSVEMAGNGTQATGFSAQVERLRDATAQRIRTTLPGQSGEIASALIVGKRGGIGDEPQDALRAAGLQHILAISGLHMALVAGSIFMALRTVLAGVGGLALNHPTRKYAALAAIAVAASYLALSGAPVSAQRAFIMTAVMFTAVLLDRPALTLRNVAIAAIAIIVFKPSAVLEAGFQMSFAATAALVSIYETTRRRRLQKDEEVFATRRFAGLRFFLTALVITALVGGLSTAPFAAYHFNRFAPYGLLGNVLAMPIVSFWVMPSAVISGLAMPLGLEVLPLKLMGAGVDAVVAVASWVASLSHAEMPVAAFPALSLWLTALALMWLVIWRGAWRYAGAAVGMVLAIGAAQASRPPDILIDRDGDLAAIQTGNGELVFAAKRKAGFVIETWLRRSGDPRPLEEGLAAVARCDATACRVTAATARGQPVTVSLQAKEQTALDACDGADIVVLSAYTQRPASCAARLAVTTDMLEDRGALGIRVDSASNASALAFEVTGANDARRHRIWHRAQPGPDSPDAEQGAQ
ncbi:ComEC/Rec2 family competence protein [Tepidamorphus sp. 3E244]|uniref:ComEC/Rec2 family competence protein n=1 Tax=Tepidamorphus sp. 3E244 TaxID=3385498 RepID=UPI0038FC6629